METFFKKHFWLLNLLPLTAAAYFVASAANDYIGLHVLTGSSAQLQIPSAAPGDGEAGFRQIPGYAEDLKTRRPFNADPLEEEVPSEGMRVVGEAEESKSSNTGEMEESSLDIQLLGTMVVDPAEHSMATVNSGGASLLVRPGSDLDGKATVKRIARRYIVVVEDGTEKLVTLWSEKKAGAARPAVAKSRPSKSPASSRPGRKKKDYSKGVTKVSDTEYQISRAMLDEQLQDLSQLGMEARIVPNYKNGKYEGFKLVGVRPNSLYRALGIRSGDVIKRINGHDINSPNKAIELFEQFRTTSSVDLMIERRGQMKTFNYGIK